jgi:transcription elongation factor GreA
MPAAATSLARWVREQNWSALEDAWTELILGDASVEAALQALAVAAERKEIPRVLPLVREHAEMLEKGARADEAAELLGTAMLQGGSPGELGRPLYRCAELAWGTEESWPVFAEIADLRENTVDMRAAWRGFKKLHALVAGRVVYHSKGWGLGVIDEVVLPARETRVRFLSGRIDRFPLSTAIEIFEVLEENDLRALVVLDPERLNVLLKKEPLEVLTWVLRRNGGRVNHAGLKMTLATLGVDGARFANWWKRARELAEASEWFEVAGAATRVTVRLLDRAEDPAELLLRQLRRSPSLSSALSRVKSALMGDSVSDAVRAVALDTLEELARNEREELSARLGTWILLREARGSTSRELGAMLAAAARQPASGDPSQPPALWALFQEVPGQREQERATELLREVHGEAWLDQAAQHLQHAAPGMARGLVEALAQAGRTKELVAHYVALLARPTRNPALLVQLAERIEGGEISGGLPAPVQRAQCLLQLCVFLTKKSPGNSSYQRSRVRLAALLSEGDPPLLKRLLAGVDLETLRNLASLIEGGVDRAIDRVFTQNAIEVSPLFFRGEDRPFWQDGGIWTTRAGLKKREGELRELRDVKIPANAEAIGKAASYGDLSENSEWEAAIEEQRTLTTRAMEIESELRSAHLIENAAIPPERVAPGQRVVYRELPSGREHRIRILGPWDGDADDIVSYRSPLASGMLGLVPGERAVVELPTGPLEVEVLGVDHIEL